MSDPLIRSQRWINKATRDFNSIHKLITEPPELSTAIFHCQQCAEKSLKAILVVNGVSPDNQRFKTHNLRYLLREATSFHPELNEYDQSIEVLNDMDTFYRYPQDEEPDEPSITEFRNAYSVSQSLFQKAIHLWFAHFQEGS